MLLLLLLCFTKEAYDGDDNDCIKLDIGQEENDKKNVVTSRVSVEHEMLLFCLLLNEGKRKRYHPIVRRTRASIPRFSKNT